MNNKKRRTYGEHLTPIEIFNEFILPKINDDIYNYRWIDLFAGEGNLILPILDSIPQKDRVNFFKEHLFLFDIQEDLIDKAIKNVMQYKIPEVIARKNIKKWDTLHEFPKQILKNGLPIYHITNPPYLYLGYIRKHKETERYLDLFEGENDGYQDLYQIAMINDLKNNLENMIYIIPTNFLFGASGTNKIRDDFLKYYNIDHAILFKKDIFQYTGVNVGIFFFQRKNNPIKSPISFEGIKIDEIPRKRNYLLKPEWHYRAGYEFEEFVNNHKSKKPVKISYYLTQEEVQANLGNHEINVIDSNSYLGNQYSKKIIAVNEQLYRKIINNILFVRTVDTGSMEGRAGIYEIKDEFEVDGILVTKAKYRTHPIQIIFTPRLSLTDQLNIKDYFNLLLEYFREITDSEFLTTYKYSNSDYVRKYLGLTQTRKLLETFPINTPSNTKNRIKQMISNKQVKRLLEIIKKINQTKIPKPIDKYFKK